MHVGIYNRRLATLGGGERYSLAIAATLSQQHTVEVISHTPVAPALIAQRMQLPLEHVRWRVVAAQPPHTLGPLTREYDLFINASHNDFVPPQASRSSLLIYFPQRIDDHLNSQLRRMVVALIHKPTTQLAWLRTLLERQAPELALRLQNPLPTRIFPIVDRYDALWTISRFTQQWVQAWWQRSSTLLYPPVDVAAFAPTAPKRNWILHVGRFFAGNHNKKHLTLIAAFRELVDHGLTDWELHLAGGLNTGQLHADYLHQVRIAAQGYPIMLHVDIAFAALAALYAQSTIYWHASGYGETELHAPEKFEHFGITTVEAMAAGCVPVVIGKGGQPEIVCHGQDGFLWQTLAELQGYTRQVITDTLLRQQLSHAARLRSQEFGHARFEQRLAAAIEALGKR